MGAKALLPHTRLGDGTNNKEEDTPNNGEGGNQGGEGGPPNQKKVKGDRPTCVSQGHLSDQQGREDTLNNQQPTGRRGNQERRRETPNQERRREFNQKERERRPPNKKKGIKKGK